MRLSLAAALLATMLASSTAAIASDSQYIVGSAGIFDIGSDYDTWNFGLEYRGSNIWKGVLPIVGVSYNTDDAYFGYAGVAYDYEITPRWIVMPSVAVAAYEKGDSRDLGGTLEFRSGLEVDYVLENQHRVGLAVHHISNAGIHDRNPGTETLMLNYAMPIN